MDLSLGKRSPNTRATERGVSLGKLRTSLLTASLEAATQCHGLVQRFPEPFLHLLFYVLRIGPASSRLILVSVDALNIYFGKRKKKDLKIFFITINGI